MPAQKSDPSRGWSLGPTFVLAQKKRNMASSEEKCAQQSEEKKERKKHRGIPEALFLVSLYLYDTVSFILCKFESICLVNFPHVEVLSELS